MSEDSGQPVEEPQDEEQEAADPFFLVHYMFSQMERPEVEEYHSLDDVIHRYTELRSKDPERFIAVFQGRQVPVLVRPAVATLDGQELTISMQVLAEMLEHQEASEDLIS